jgi:hypothetical protein
MAFLSRTTTLAAVLWALLLGLASSCVSPYVPDVPAAQQDYLVIDGFINSQGITSIRLTRSLQLQATKAPAAEAKAAVAIQATGGQRFALTESPAGTYTSASLTLNPALTYKLSITTAAGKSYETDYLPVKTTPAIDKVYWRYENEGVQIYVDAHDANRATTYYRWKYQETWQFTSAIESHYQYNPITKVIEPRLDDIYHCWGNNISTAITQTNTTRLSQDVVQNFPLVFLPANSEKLPIRYSILVQQYAQTKEEYDYWETLKKNSENLGTINDPLPSQVTGNVHCLSTPDEPALGYVGIHSVSEQRIFIDRKELPQPNNFVFQTGYEKCAEVQEERCPKHGPPFPPGVTHIFGAPGIMITSTDGDSNCPLGNCYLTACTYFGGLTECVDCRLRGTNVKPSFWK